jgi:hypothetical protein
VKESYANVCTTLVGFYFRSNFFTAKVVELLVCQAFSKEMILKGINDISYVNNSLNNVFLQRFKNH